VQRHFDATRVGNAAKAARANSAPRSWGLRHQTDRPSHACSDRTISTARGNGRRNRRGRGPPSGSSGGPERACSFCSARYCRSALARSEELGNCRMHWESAKRFDCRRGCRRQATSLDSRCRDQRARSRLRSQRSGDATRAPARSRASPARRRHHAISCPAARRHDTARRARKLRAPGARPTPAAPT